MLRVETGDARVNETMITAIPHRRPFLGKLGTSILKRRVRLIRWLARTRGSGKAPLACRYFGADFIVMPGEVIGDQLMRLVPIVGRSRVDLKRHRERNGRKWRFFHYPLDHWKCASDLVFRHFEDEFVVDLQQHLR